MTVLKRRLAKLSNEVSIDDGELTSLIDSPIALTENVGNYEPSNPA